MRYEIPEPNVAKLVKELERLAKRAAKLGCEPPAWVLGEKFVKTRKEGGDPNGRTIHEQYVPVEVEGKAPRYEGWRLAAVLQNLGEGNLVKAVPDEPEGLLTQFREVEIKCEHCKTKRHRTETFVMGHEDGRLLQVGRQCIRDFLGHKSPEGLAKMAELMAALRELCEDAEEGGWGGGGGKRVYEIETFLTMVACLIRRDGWMSRTVARQLARTATADDALMALDPDHLTRQAWERDPELEPKPTTADHELAAKAVEWATQLPEDVNDYLWNVRLVTRFGYVDPRSAGVAGSVVQAYRKAMGDEVKRKMLEKSEWFGEEKKREVWTLTLTDRWDTDGTYGTTRIHRFMDAAGNVAVWFATKHSGMEVGETWKVKATVKKHDWRNRVKQTVLTRCDAVEKVQTEQKETASEV